VGVAINEFIAYAQNSGFTRLNLTGGKILEVKETTDQIDRLVRAASSQPNPPSRRIAGEALALNLADGSAAATMKGVEEQAEFPGMPRSSKIGHDPQPEGQL
jgi:hypothetical protein